jgi:hypothetical protein
MEIFMRSEYNKILNSKKIEIFNGGIY